MRESQKVYGVDELYISSNLSFCSKFALKSIDILCNFVYNDNIKVLVLTNFTEIF